MGLFSKALINRGIERAARMWDSIEMPKGMTPEEWLEVRLGLRDGNEQLRDAMTYGGQSSGWEWGGTAGPEGNTAIRTDQSQGQVGVPAFDGGSRTDVIYHNHPSQLLTENGDYQLPVARLSLPDLQFSKGHHRGTTALDGTGGYGYALHADGSPELSDDVWNELNNRVPKEIEKSGTLFGVPWTLQSASAPTRSRPSSEASFPLLVGTGRAMKNTGLLEQYGLIPGTKQQAQIAQLYEPAAEAATSAAERIIRDWLSAKGYPDGVVKGIIASLAATGSLISTANDLAGDADV